jgi:GAF domain-containing protein
VTLPDARTEPRFSAESPKVAFVVCSPLVHDGQVLGAIYADSLGPQQVTPAEASFFEAVGHLLSVALRG